MGFEIFGWRKQKELQEKEVSLARASQLRTRVQNLLFTDRVSHELKEMAEAESGCVFVALIHVLKYFDSPVLQTKENQREYIQKFKELFESLSAGVLVSSIVRHQEILLPDITFSKLLYMSRYLVEFQDEVFADIDQKMLLPLDWSNNRGIGIPQLKETELALLFLRNIELEGHCIALDNDEFLSGGGSYGKKAVQDYIEDGFVIYAILIVEKDQTATK